MRIEWGAIAEESTQFKDAIPLSKDVEFQNFLLAYAEPFMANWQLEVPTLFAIETGGSCYCFETKGVYLNFNVTDNQARRANKNLTQASNAEELAALFCLCHELTHAVQHHYYGVERVLQTPLLMEAHADTVAGYWLTPQLRKGVLDLVGNIAFQLHRNPKNQSHPPGCTRRTSVVKGMSIGSAMLIADGDLTASISSRQQLLKDSMTTATECLFSTPRPCDALAEYWTQVNEPLCSTCPKAPSEEAGT